MQRKGIKRAQSQPFASSLVGGRRNRPQFSIAAAQQLARRGVTSANVNALMQEEYLHVKLEE